MSSSGIFSQDLRHWISFKKSQKHLQKQNIEPENFEDRIIFMSMFKILNGREQKIQNVSQIPNKSRITRRNSRRGTGHSLDLAIVGIWASSIQKCCSVGSWNSEDEEQQGDQTFHCGCFKHRAFYVERFTQQISTVSTEQSQAGV